MMVAASSSKAGAFTEIARTTDPAHRALGFCLQKLGNLEPDLRLGWTFPKTRRDWTAHSWLRPALMGGLALMQISGDQAARR